MSAAPCLLSIASDKSRLMPMRMMHLGLTWLVLLLFIQVYYLHIKKFIFAQAPLWAHVFGLTHRYPVTVAAGVLQFSVIVCTHVLLCTSLCGYLEIKPLNSLSLSLISGMWCVVIGVGCVTVATLLCQLGMVLGVTFFSAVVPVSAAGWWRIARAGWMRHHQHNMAILPLSMALLMVLLQLTAEEIIFRVIMLQLFSEAGSVMAIFISTTFFMYMQIFHMPSRASAMFPVLGALVLGCVNAVLYELTHSVTALIIIHMSYFIVAVLI